MGLVKALSRRPRAAVKLAARQLAGELSASSDAGPGMTPQCSSPPLPLRDYADASIEPTRLSSSHHIRSACDSELGLASAHLQALTLRRWDSSCGIMTEKGTHGLHLGPYEQPRGEHMAMQELHQLRRHTLSQVAMSSSSSSSSVLSQPGMPLSGRNFSSGSIFAPSGDDQTGERSDGMAAAVEGGNLEQRPGRRMNLFTAVNDALATALDTDPR